MRYYDTFESPHGGMLLVANDALERETSPGRQSFCRTTPST